MDWMEARNRRWIYHSSAVQLVSGFFRLEIAEQQRMLNPITINVIDYSGSRGFLRLKLTVLCVLLDACLLF